jgi:glycerol-3-phosphate dehydrogenase
LESISGEVPGSADLLSEKLGIRKAQVIHAVRHEMALTVEDVLARRTRALQLDAGESIRMAPAVAEIMAGEMRRDREWMEHQLDDYKAVAEGYLLK